MKNATKLSPSLLLSGILVLASLILLVTPGLKLSIDFTGGTLMELIPANVNITNNDVDEAILKAPEFTPPLGNVDRTLTRDGTIILRSRDLTNEEHIELREHLDTALAGVTEQQFTTIGPTVGSTLKSRAMWALLLAMAAIILYVAFAFRSIPRKYSPMRFGMVAVITLLHDLLLTVGVFIIIAQFTAFEVDTLFITALLTILGYSVNDTIVIFDRLRDGLKGKSNKNNFAALAGEAVDKSWHRSLNTSASTLIMLLCLFLLGSASIQWFVLTLIVGTIIGTYSSLFVAPSLLVWWQARSQK